MSRRDEIKADEKVRIAKAYTQGKIGISEAAKQIGVHHTVIKDWIQLYQTEGATAFLPKEGNRQYDPVVKEMAVKDYLSGSGSLREICKIYKIRNKIQLRTWIKVYNGHPLLYGSIVTYWRTHCKSPLVLTLTIEKDQNYKQPFANT